jgi:signal peptidase
MILIKIYNLVTKILTTILFIIIAVIAVSLIPLPGNYRLYSVVSGSMSPTLPVGSVVAVKPQTDYQVGDVVTFQPAGQKTTVTHRITGKSAVDNQTVFQTKGDANQVNDNNSIPHSNVIGRVIFQLPYLGYPISFSKTQTGLILLIIVPSTLLIYSEILTIKSETLKLIKQRRERRLTTAETIEEKIGEGIIEVEKDIKKLTHLQKSKK